MRTAPTQLARIGTLVLAVAVVFRLAISMTGSGDMAMQVAMICCLVLAVLVGFALMGRSQRNAATAVASDRARLRPHGVLALARAPDPITLGALLI